ncbi:DUF859 family phage minor structural protein [Streptococcus suis]|uniref:DUF859 family phage minor structural protein n=1 Tax=Streptococcus suis TaxID=1307 RepID=UPI000CF71FAD|nr:DUF859 family phage minor structural protein [Streptococcus suis]
MAKFSNASGFLYLNVYIEPGAQNIAANTTVVNWRITVSRTGNYLTRNEQGDSTLSLDLNGGRVHTSNPRWRTSGEEFQMASGSTTVGHNADGTKSFPFSATFNPNNGLHGIITVSGNIGLATIPRSSSVSVSSGVIGSALTININRQSSSFKHTVRYHWGNKQGTIASNVDTSTTWTIPLDFANNIPNATSGTGTIFVDTYSGSTMTGTQQVAFTANVPASMKPTFSGITLTDTNGVARSLLSGNNFLQIISNIQVTFNGHAGTYGSTVTGYKAEIVNRNLVTNSNGGTLGIMNFSGSATIRASVVDSRGRWSDTKDVTINVIEYFAPILSYTALRTRETPSIIQIVRNAKIAPITLSGSQKNIMTLSFKVAPLGSTSYTADNGSASGSWTTQHTLSNSAANMAGNYPANKSFTIIGTLSDKFTSVEFSATVATESVVMSYDKDNRFAVGKIVDMNLPGGSVESTGGYYLNGKSIQNHRLTENSGQAIPAFSDWNNYVDTGFYYGQSMANQPPFDGQNQWKYIKVSKHDNDWVLQESIDFSGMVSCYRVKIAGSWQPWKMVVTEDHPLLQEKPFKTLTMGFPYGLNATLIRKDSLVTITLNRRITNIDVFEYSQMVEIIPSGYRPTVETHMLMAPNVGGFTKSPSVLHFASDGKIRLTNGTGGAHVYTGTITYITNDPYPT